MSDPKLPRLPLGTYATNFYDFDLVYTKEQMHQYAITALSARASAGEGGYDTNAFIRLDFKHADGRDDCKLITHDEMRQRYADATATAPQPAHAVFYDIPGSGGTMHFQGDKAAHAGASGGGGYDRELVAKMLDDYERRLRHDDEPDGYGYAESSVAEQAELLREADNAEAAMVSTVRLTTPASPATGQVAAGCTHVWVPGQAGMMYCDQCDRQKPAATPRPAAAQGGWLLDGNLIYQLSDERQPQNTHEIKVTQWNGSRNMKDCDAAARELYRALAAAPQPQEVPVQECRCIDDYVCDRCNEQTSRAVASAAYATPPAHGDGEVVLPELPFPDTFTSDSFNGMKLYFTAEQMREYARQVLTTRPTPEAQEARDAARYRWLRNNSVGQWQHPIVVSQRRAAFDTMQYIGPLAGTSLDAAIDAALALPAQGEGNNG